MILESEVLAVSPGVGVPTGVVTYLRKGRVLATEALVNGTASLTLKPTRALKKATYVAYSGEADFDASTSVNVVPTTKSLRASARCSLRSSSEDEVSGVNLIATMNEPRARPLLIEGGSTGGQGVEVELIDFDQMQP